MLWLRLAVAVRTHPKLLQAVKAAGGTAGWFWLCGLLYAREQSTDGFLAENVLDILAPGLKGWKKAPAALVDANLWTRVEGGYQIRDYLEWNPSKAQLAANRESDRDRKAAARAGEKQQGSDGRPSDVRPDTPRTDSERPVLRADAGARAGASSPSLSALDCGSALGLEESRETFPVGGGKPRPIIESPLKWGLQHGDHLTGFCDWMCFPNELVNQFAARLAERDQITHVDAVHEVERWARSVRGSGVVPTGKMFDFWNGQWQATHGSSAPVQDGAAGRQARSAQRVRNFVERG